MGEIIYNGQTSKSFGLEVETFPSYTTPKRKYEKVNIPGRNGDLILDQGSWENVKRSYIVSIGSYTRSYTEMMAKLSDWLHSTTSYARLEDSYEPDYFRLATFLDEGSMTNIYNHGSEMNLDFDCKPQRFLKIGEKPITVTSEAKVTLINPTQYRSYPIITVKNAKEGNILIGEYKIQVVKPYTSNMIIDCELEDVYASGANLNSYVKFDKTFPAIEPGKVNISVEGTMTLEVIPRWYTL